MRTLGILTDSVIRKMGKWQEDCAARCTLCLFLESLMKLPVPWLNRIFVAELLLGHDITADEA